ncbi:MAG: pyridoxamine 5'-phosphate oxidase family protein [Natronohydrobacter sp.]|nr:pyridoxamine 5'-phosphate oxidase family protein [Natronohydrobacter sp.]
MGTSYSAIDESHAAFIAAQPMFFVATAAREGRVNLSPKGLDALRVLAPDRVIWLNLTGSGNETAAHILDSPRMTLMFCAFNGPPKTLRLYGQARLLHLDTEEGAALAAHFPRYAGTRQIFDLKVDLVHSSCGMGVPEMALVAPRAESQLVPYFERLGPEKTVKYQQVKNRRSLDGQPTDIV